MIHNTPPPFTAMIETYGVAHSLYDHAAVVDAQVEKLPNHTGPGPVGVALQAVLYDAVVTRALPYPEVVEAMAHAISSLVGQAPNPEHTWNTLARTALPLAQALAAERGQGPKGPR